jgi:DNA polymerase-3 subunit delta
MDLLTLRTNLTPENLAPVYLLHGPERFIIDQAVAQIREIVVQGPMADFNYSRYKAKELSGAEIVAKAGEIPMMAAKRLLLIDDGHKLGTKDLEALDPYLAQPAPETCLVVVAERFDLRRGILARANKRKQVHKADLLKENQLLPFLKSRAKERGVSLSQGALAAVCAAIGSNCAALDDAVERLGLFVGFDSEVTEEAVTEIVTNIREHSVFELVDAIGNRTSDRALVLLEGLLAEREEPIRINAMLARHLRHLLVARIQLHLGADQSALAGLIGIPPFAVKKIIGQSRRFRGAKLEQYLARVAEADFELKSSRRTSKVVMEEVILDLCLA